jgi:large conductance mechanosensitive channel
MINEFKNFLMRGNVIDLAVAVVIGAAFSGVVNSLVEDLINPLLAAIIGQPDFSDLTFTIRDATFTYGNFISAVINFVLIAAAIFFLVVKPVNIALERRARGQAPEDPTVKQCPECLSEIPIAATRCAFCGIQLSDAAATGPVRA